MERLIVAKQEAIAKHTAQIEVLEEKLANAETNKHKKNLKVKIANQQRQLDLQTDKLNQFQSELDELLANPITINAQLDKENYVTGDTLVLNGSVSEVTDWKVNYKLLDQSDNQIEKGFAPIQWESDVFRKSISLDESMAPGTYTINLTYDAAEYTLMFAYQQGEIAPVIDTSNCDRTAFNERNDSINTRIYNLNELMDSLDLEIQDLEIEIFSMNRELQSADDQVRIDYLEGELFESRNTMIAKEAQYENIPAEIMELQNELIQLHTANPIPKITPVECMVNSEMNYEMKLLEQEKIENVELEAKLIRQIAGHENRIDKIEIQIENNEDPNRVDKLNDRLAKQLSKLSMKEYQLQTLQSKMTENSQRYELLATTDNPDVAYQVQPDSEPIVVETNS